VKKLNIDWNGKTAVISGGASGIGLAIVEKCLSLNMKVVLADINERDINSALNKFSSYSSNIIGVKTDVSKYYDVEELMKKA